MFTMKRILFLILLSVSLLGVGAQDVWRRFCPNPEANEDSCGYVNANNEIVIPAGKYRRLYSSEFHKIAFVSIKGKSGIYAINRDEQILFRVKVTDNGPDAVSEGLFRIERDGKLGFADMNGDIVIEPQFQFVYPFQPSGYAVFCQDAELIKEGEYACYKNGKWGAIDRKGRMVVPLGKFEQGKSDKLMKNGMWFDWEEWNDSIDTVKITGTVTDKETGKPIGGADIRIK